MVSLIYKYFSQRSQLSGKGLRRDLAGLLLLVQLVRRVAARREEVVYREVIRPGEQIQLSHLDITRYQADKITKKEQKAAKRQAKVDAKQAKLDKAQARAARKSAKRVHAAPHG